MGKKSKKSASILKESEIKPLLELKFGVPLFAIASHPTKPIIAVGLANGYVFAIEYDAKKLKEYSNSIHDDNVFKQSKSIKKENGEVPTRKIWKVENITKEDIEDETYIKYLWKTKRHKGSVRAICFNDWNSLYSVGSDNVLKKADALTGQVIRKCTLDSRLDKITKILPDHKYLILGDETGNILIYDSSGDHIVHGREYRQFHRSEDDKFFKNANDDAITSITIDKTISQSHPRYLSTGSTCLTVFNSKKDIPVSTSEDQEDEILSSAAVGSSQDGLVVCGMGEGVLTVWKYSKNQYNDQISRIKINKDESIDSVISTMRDDNCVWAGSSDGLLNKVNVRKGTIIETRVHSRTDEVGLLDIDHEYRLISAGMDKLKIWNELDDDKDDEEDEDSEEKDDDFDVDVVDSDQVEEETKNDDDSESEEFQEFEEDEEFHGFSDSEWEVVNDAPESLEKESNIEEEEEEGEEEEVDTKKTKKSKDQKLVNAKQLRNHQKHEHGIRKFDDL